MKPIAVIFCCYIFSIAGNISNFAPTNIGSKWTYSFFSEERTGGGKTIDSQTIVLKICQSIKTGSDSILQIQITQTGLRYIYYPWTSIDTISKTYFDTVLVRDGSLLKKTHTDSNGLWIDYKSPVFPFWKSHTIESDSLQLENLMGSDLYTLFFNEPHVTGYRKSVYIQNVGLYKDSICWLRGSLGEISSIHLLSFEPPENSFCKHITVLNNHRSSIAYRLTTFTKRAYLHGTAFITIDGKNAIFDNRCIPGCYILQKDVKKH